MLLLVLLQLAAAAAACSWCCWCCCWCCCLLLLLLLVVVVLLLLLVLLVLLLRLVLQLVPASVLVLLVLPPLPLLPPSRSEASTQSQCCSIRSQNVRMVTTGTCPFLVEISHVAAVRARAGSGYERLGDRNGPVSGQLHFNGLEALSTFQSRQLL